MKVLTAFHLINEISTAFYAFDFPFTSVAKMYSSNCAINNQGFKVLIVNSGTKHDFKYEKPH